MNETHSVQPDPTPEPVPALSGSHAVFLVGYLALLASSKWLLRAAGLPEVGRAWIVVGLYTALAVWGVVAFRAAFVRSWRLTAAAPLTALVLFALTAIGTQVAPMLADLVLSAAGVPVDSPGSNDDNAARLAMIVPAILFALVIGVFGPLVEELVFREVLVFRLGRRLPAWACVAVSSFGFGLIHVHSWAEAPLALIYATIGLVYALVMRASKGNLFIGAAEHVLTNSVAVLGLLVAQ